MKTSSIILGIVMNLKHLENHPIVGTTIAHIVNGIHFKTHFFAKVTPILKRRKYLHLLGLPTVS